MAKDNNLLILGIAGGAGLAIYIAMQKQREAKSARLIAQSEGVPVGPEPGLWDSLVGKAKEEFSEFLEKRDSVEEKVRARGSLHFSQWKSAVDKSKNAYVDGDQCFSTATGEKLGAKDCPPELFLEGY